MAAPSNPYDFSAALAALLVQLVQEIEQTPFLQWFTLINND